MMKLDKSVVCEVAFMSTSYKSVNAYLRFLREGKIHVAVHSRRDHFEVGNLNDADLATLRLKFRSEVRYVTELIDALLAVDTLYKQ